MAKGKRNNFLAALLIIIIPVTFYYFFAIQFKRPTLQILPIAGNHQVVEKTDSSGNSYNDTIYHSLPKFSFISHLGDTVTNEVMNNRVVIVDYFFTTCPNICIDMSKSMYKVQQKFIDEDHVFLLSHTVDPDTDTVKTLHEYAQLYDVNPKKWLLLTGAKKELYEMARQGYLISAAIPGDGGEHDFIHDNHLVLVDKEGRVRGFYDGTNEEEVDELILDTKKLLVSYILPPKKNRIKRVKKQ